MMIDRTGQQLGNYRLLRSLGSGGFADVYLGEHIYLNTLAAIKILQTRLAQQDLQVFLAEARTIANLTHRNIVQVLEFGVEKDTPFLVMTYAPNGTLRHRHPYGSRLSTSEGVAYIRQVADALQYAHERKVIHRDVKPENMLVGHNGDILLSDFGIAVVAQSSRYGGQEVGGTAAYMAPEQLQGRAVPASDQYALAVTAYEWLTGERPFHGSFAEICSQHVLTAPTPLRQKVPSLPPAVEQVVLHALNKEPQQRFPSVQTFANALAQASGGNTPVTYDTRTEGQLSTLVKPPSRPISPPPGSNPSLTTPVFNNLSTQGNTPSFPYPALSPSRQGNTSSFTYPASNNPSPHGNVNPPSFTQSGIPSSGPFPPQGPPIQQENKRRGNKGMLVAIVALLVILIVGASASWIYFSASKKTSSTGGVGQTRPTATSPSIPASSSPTSSTTATPTIQPAATVASGVITKNLTLTCSQCSSDPVHVTINSIQIDTANGRMVWDTTLRDVTKSGRGFSFVEYALEASGSTTEVSAVLSQTQFPSGTNQADMQAIFAFVPSPGVTYTLTIIVNWAYNTTNNLPFDPVKLTF